MHKIWIDTPLLPEAMADLYREAEAILPEARNPNNQFDQIEEAHALILGQPVPGYQAEPGSRLESGGLRHAPGLASITLTLRPPRT